MISLSPVLECLRLARPALPAGVPWFRQVEGAAAFARLASLPQVPLPGCWVIRTADRSTPHGEGCSLVRVQFDVVIGVTNHRIASAGDSDDVLLVYRRAVLAQLQERSLLAEQVDPLERVGGAAIEYTEGDLWWRDQYECEARLTHFLPDPPAF